MSTEFDRLVDDLFNPFCFDKAFFNAQKEERDCSYIKGSKEITIVHNVLGINKEDLKLTKKIDKGESYIVISGKTKDTITEKEYSIDSRIHVIEDNLDMSKIKSSMKNGLLYITIPYQKKKNTNTEEIINIQ